jgi:hypothetical protein
MTEVARTDTGQFEKGVSGNPAGRPKGRKNEIIELKQDLEIAIRKHLTPDKVARIVDKMVQLAENGRVGAAKLLLDKVVSNARDGDEMDDKSRGGITIRIENATFAKQRENTEAVDGHFTEVSK